MLSLLVSQQAIFSSVPVGGQTRTLTNGLAFPVVSFGLQVYDDDTAEAYTKIAVAAGIRNFFTSVLAGNQVGFGAAIANVTSGPSAVARKDLFICGSVNSGGACSGKADCQTQTAAGCVSNMAATKLKYLDMIMLDYPAGDCDSIQGQWLAFEAMLKAGTTKSIAVSNFTPEQIDCLIAAKMTAPVVNQMPYSVGSGSNTVVADDAQRGVVVQAYSPLGGGGLVSDPDCVAIGKAHGKSAAQVALRWIVQRNGTFTTSASTAQYFKEDVDIFDFALSATEMATLTAKSALLQN
jgi:diketogulonate reductase-like aldo/keto reductase